MQAIPPLHKGDLKKYGYAVKNKASTRRRSLSKAVKSYGYLSVEHKLNAVSVLSKNSSPKHSKTYRSDMRWIKKRYSK